MISRDIKKFGMGFINWINCFLFSLITYYMCKLISVKEVEEWRGSRGALGERKVGKQGESK